VSRHNVEVLIGAHHASSSTTDAYLGLTGERERRNKSLHGKPFLTAMVTTDNVVQLSRRGSE